MLVIEITGYTFPHLHIFKFAHLLIAKQPEHLTFTHFHIADQPDFLNVKWL